jgi:mRNA interferase HigB
VRIIARKTLARFAESRIGTADYRAVSSALSDWAEQIEAVRFSNVAELKRKFGNASAVGERVVFNIKGNSYRLVVGFNYDAQLVYLKWFGSHAAYDQIDVRTVRYEP